MTTELFDRTLFKDVFGVREKRLDLLRTIITFLYGTAVVKGNTSEADFSFVKAFMTKQVPISPYPEDFPYPTTFSHADCVQTAAGARVIYNHYRVDQSTEEYPQTPVWMIDLFQRVHPEEKEMRVMLREYAVEP